MRQMRLVLPLMLLALATPVRAAEVDQEFTGPASTRLCRSTRSFLRAQTFTVGRAGTLTQVDLSLALGPATLATDEILFDVRPTDESGTPFADDGSALAVVAIPATQLTGVLDPGDLFEIDLSTFALQVAPGDRLAIVARAAVPFFGGRAFSAGAASSPATAIPGASPGIGRRPRPGSCSPDGDGVDLVFRTWVPEPGALASALAAFGALAARRRLSSS